MSDEPSLKLAPAVEPGREERPKGFWRKLKKGLFMTHTELLERLDDAVAGKAVLDEEVFEHLEEALIGADLGAPASLAMIESVRGRARGWEAQDVVKLREMLVDEMAVLLLEAPRPPLVPEGRRVVLLVGVNGTGKTTTAAKLARRSLDASRRPLLAAADTFRAAAVEQLTLWADRLEIGCIRQGHGADPAAVVFDALQAARARGVDDLIVDTAGRLHNKSHLMEELGKIKRVVDREAPDWDRRTLLVVDATTGQNAVSQAREFVRAVEVDGVVLSKIDGTAKGGMAVALASELRLPVWYLGVGEQPADLVEFRARDFASALLGV